MVLVVGYVAYIVLFQDIVCKHKTCQLWSGLELSDRSRLGTCAWHYIMEEMNDLTIRNRCL